MLASWYNVVWVGIGVHVSELPDEWIENGVCAVDEEEEPVVELVSVSWDDWDDGVFGVDWGVDVTGLLVDAHDVKSCGNGLFP